ncbi:MAG: FAD-dependent monooxygenase [Spirochaetales bacterium]|nr:FAD-dependent monooxygenase [Spirochaetales bacterium]
MKEYDYLIVGGGPAGSTLARLIGKKYRVALVEGDGEDSEGKICGGLIAPDAQKMLGRFGLSLPKDVLVSPQMFYVDSLDLQTGNSGKYQRHYLNVDRKRFDNWLLSQLPPQVDLYRPARYVNHEEKDDCLEVTIKSPEGRIKLKTSYLIGADGGQSAVRRKTAGDFKNQTKYISLQSRIVGHPLPDCYEAFFDPLITDFYGWTIPKGEDLLIGIALKEGNLREKYEAFLGKVLGEDYDERERRACTIIRPAKGSDYRTGWGKRIFFIGEAAGFISPSSAEGFSYAFKSARFLGDAILGPGNTEKAYRRKARSLKAQLFLKRKKGMVMYNSFLRNLIFRTGLGGL